MPSAGTINPAALNDALANSSTVTNGELVAATAATKANPPYPRLPGQEPFEHEATYDEKEQHDFAFVRHEMRPFLPYLDAVRRQRNAPPHIVTRNLEERYCLIQNWLSVCDTKHSDHCYTPMKQTGDSAGSAPIWFIDVENECIVPALSGARYIALSYVWGENVSSISSTTASNLNELRKMGSLSRKGPVPKKIAQVMSLACRLQIPFLWVDRFCIVQDDSSKQAQFDSMAAIYASAYLTVVAAEGEGAEDEIIALRDDQKGCSQSLKDRQYFDGRSWKHGTIMEWYSVQLLNSKWINRGWTLQEQLFSRRKVIFQDSTINWECHCGCWQEGQGLFGGHDQEPCSSPPHISLVNPSAVPDMYRYARLVSRYNRRDLTFAADAIDAFAGVLSDLSRVFTSGFISGLPVFCFDAALLWQPWGLAQKRFNDSMADSYDLPSWSWVGWHCDVNSESLRSAYGYIRANVDEFSLAEWYPTSWHTYPTVDWFYSDTINSARRHIPRILSPTAATDAQDEAFTPPEGWEKLRCPRSNKFYYRQSLSGDGFWYPIPLADPSKLPLPVNRSRFLHCRTRRAFLETTPLYAPFRHSSSACGVLELVAPNSTCSDSIGVLRIPPEFRKGDIRHPDRAYELIELSAGSVENQPTEEVSFDEWRLRSKGASWESGKYEFYNVMWVERNENGVCFRRAIGRIEKSAWEKLDKEIVDTIIG